MCIYIYRVMQEFPNSSVYMLGARGLGNADSVLLGSAPSAELRKLHRFLEAILLTTKTMQHNQFFCRLFFESPI